MFQFIKALQPFGRIKQKGDPFVLSLASNVYHIRYCFDLFVALKSIQNFIKIGIINRTTLLKTSGQVTGRDINSLFSSNSRGKADI